MDYIPVHNLEIYQLSEKLSDIIWYAYDSWNFKARETIGIQIIRSSDSIAVNLAEGYGRYKGPDRKRFYIMARGSFEETKAWLRKADRRKLLTDDVKIELTEITMMLGPKLNAFIKSQCI